MEQEPRYHLEGVIRDKEEMADFEGPLTLILMLLSKNKIEIRDIRIAEILEQYLAWMDEMKSMDLEIASEFVQMAAHLLYIKTRMLLASSREAATDELETLMESLEALKAKGALSAIKEVAAPLEQWSLYGARYTVKPPEPLPCAREYRYHHEGWELLRALLNVFQRGRTAADEAEEDESHRKRILPKRVIYPVRAKSREILLTLAASERVSLRQFYASSHSRSEVVAAFISILELCSIGRARLERGEGEDYDVVFNGGDTEEILAAIPE